MALTGLTNLQPLHIKTVGIGTFDNAVSIGGTLTYEDVTNVDAIGIITARSGINVSGGQLDVGSNIKLGNAGVITATSFVGSGANLTSIPAGNLTGTVADARISTLTASKLTGALPAISGANLTGVLKNVVEDSSPQLGGDLQSNGNDIRFADNDKARFGASADIEIYHDNSNSRSYVLSNTDNQLRILQAGNAGMLIQNQNSYNIEIKTNAEDAIKCVANGAVELYHNNVKKFETAADRVNVTGHIFMLGGNRLYLQNGFQNSYASINNTGGSNDSNLNFHIRDAGTESTALKIQKTGNVEISGDKGLYIGASQDMQLYHNGTDSYILNATGNLRIGQYNNANLKFFTSNSTRWEIDGSGHFLPDANNSFDIGSTSKRVRNIYTNDLNLSNKGSTNSVDNTWGDYTIQEGESDLFLINNRSGKKYKFNLTEVS